MRGWRSLKIDSEGYRGMPCPAVWPSCVSGYCCWWRLVSEHSLQITEPYSHAGNCVHVHGSGKTRGKEAEFKRDNHGRTKQRRWDVPTSSVDKVQKQPGVILQGDFQRFPLDGSVSQHMSLQRFLSPWPGLDEKCPFTDEKMVCIREAEQLGPNHQRIALPHSPYLGLLGTMGDLRFCFQNAWSYFCPSNLPFLFTT